MSNKYCKLIMVSDSNNNKYYEMSYSGGNNFTVKYGRVELTEATASYPIYQWDKKYNEKIGKGYKDVTEMTTVIKTDQSDSGIKIGDIKDSRVKEFLTRMKGYTDKLVSSTYSVKAENVTQKQIDEAQDLLTLLSKIKKIDVKDINDWLINLYTVIPRRMGNVRDYLLPNIDLQNVIEQEQRNLDAMASQVSMIKPKTKKSRKEKSILDVLGIEMKETKSNKDIQYLVDQCTNSKNSKIEAIFEVKNPKEDKIFNEWISKQDNKETRILIHGTRNTSVIPILDIGLKIRPVGNFQFSGKAYGDGNYYSETVQKSLGYTGSDKDKVLLVYEVHVGNPFVYEGWYRGNSFNLNYENLKERGFDSTFVKAGNGLLNSEIIAYKEQQNRIRYIIWLS